MSQPPAVRTHHGHVAVTYRRNDHVTNGDVTAMARCEECARCDVTASTLYRVCVCSRIYSLQCVCVCVCARNARGALAPMGGRARVRVRIRVRVQGGALSCVLS